MSVETILEHITKDTQGQSQKIVQEAQQEAAAITQQAQKKADQLYVDLLAKEKALYAAQKQRVIVNARMEYKKDLLGAKQELISLVLEKVKHQIGKGKLKKEQIAQDKVQEVSEDIDFFLEQLRRDYETEIAETLFA